MKPVVIVMGVTASGKTTVAKLLAERLQCPFLEGDDMHSPENRRKLKEGIPLTDEDRLPWLQSIGEWVRERQEKDESGTVSCSALRRTYRDGLRANHRNACFVFLNGDRKILEERLQKRKGHFVSPSLLTSQLETLEPPRDDERAVSIPLDISPEEQCDRVIAWLNDSPCFTDVPTS